MTDIDVILEDVRTDDVLTPQVLAFLRRQHGDRAADWLQKIISILKETDGRYALYIDDDSGASDYDALIEPIRLYVNHSYSGRLGDIFAKLVRGLGILCLDLAALRACEYFRK